MEVMEVHIRKYGERMNSPDVTRSKLYIEIQPYSSLSTIVSTLRNLDKMWEYDPPHLDPWYRYQPCKYCSERAKYELTKFAAGEWFWNRRWCMRHYLIEHLGDILDYDDVVPSNRSVDFYMSKSEIKLVTGSNNYKYNILINRLYAIVNVEYKGTRYAFKYNNHANSLPFASSYAVLLYEVGRVGRHFIEFLNDIKRQKEKFGCSSTANIYINGDLYLPACSETKRCLRCRILR